MTKTGETKKHVAILGSTGSIGIQALEVIRQHPGHFVVEVLTANDNSKLLIRQAYEFNPNAVVIANEDKYPEILEALEKTDIKVFAGKEAIEQIVGMESINIVLNALVGFDGLSPTLRAVEAQKDIALANKESLVIAGELINQMSNKHKTNIYPVDSEHSAILQCIVGEELNPIEKIYLTASGGPFRQWELSSLEMATPEEALQHPNWDMGKKITIDSASLINKGLEVIEAKWLFGLKPSQIEVIIHPQSIIHSMVQFEDGSMKAQMGLPDMKVPIQYALGFPKRLTSDFERLNFLDFPQLTFEIPDLKRFPALALAYDAMKKGGNTACTLNAANEIAVDAFLNKKIKFTDIPKILEKTMEQTTFIKHPDEEDYINTNYEARLIATEYIG